MKKLILLITIISNVAMPFCSSMAPGGMRALYECQQREREQIEMQRQVQRQTEILEEQLRLQRQQQQQNSEWNSGWSNGWR